MKTLLIFFMILGLLVSYKLLFYRIVPFIEQYILTSEIDIKKRYRTKNGPWVLITGPSSGMGECFAHEFAKRGFNLLLIGSNNTKKVIKELKIYNTQIKFIKKDFSESFKDNFFDNIQREIDIIGDDWSILINNVGYRTGSVEYDKMPLEEMKKTISVGTLVQSKLIQMALEKFKTRKTHTSIVNITAQNSIYTDLFAIDNEITVPYLACYEATNAYGYFHAKSVYEEIKYKYPLIDFLIIMPGAVKTKNTESVLKNTIFAVDVESYVKNIIKLMGNYNGSRCAYYGHSLSSGLINIFPFFNKEHIVKKVGSDFAKSFTKI